jgi:hypothetical protein
MIMLADCTAGVDVSSLVLEKLSSNWRVSLLSGTSWRSVRLLFTLTPRLTEEVGVGLNWKFT